MMESDRRARAGVARAANRRTTSTSRRSRTTSPRTTPWCGATSIDPDKAALADLAQELGLNNWAVEDAVAEAERTKAAVYRTHTFFTVYAVSATAARRRLRIDARDAPHLRVRAAAGADHRAAVAVVRHRRACRSASTSSAARSTASARWCTACSTSSSTATSRRCRRSTTASRRSRTTCSTNNTPQGGLQRKTFRLRKDLVELRRVVLPMREVVNSIQHRRLDAKTAPELDPLYADLYDHVLRVSEWTESLRDMVTTVFETNLSLQDARLNTVMKKLTGWAASHHNCFSGLFTNGMTDSVIEGIVSVRNAANSGAPPCGGNCLVNSNNNHIVNSLFGGNGSVCAAALCAAVPTVASNNDFGVGLIGTSSGNLIEDNSISGNSNGILIQTGASGNTIRRNIVAGNPPSQVSRTVRAGRLRHQGRSADERRAEHVRQELVHHICRTGAFRLSEFSRSGASEDLGTDGDTRRPLASERPNGVGDHRRDRDRRQRPEPRMSNQQRDEQ